MSEKEGVLPEGWMGAYRESAGTHYMDVKERGRDDAEPCFSCPGARVQHRIIHATLPNGTLVTFEDRVVGCIFLDKCIKEYPHMRTVKKEFK